MLVFCAHNRTSSLCLRTLSTRTLLRHRLPRLDARLLSSSTPNTPSPKTENQSKNQPIVALAKQPSGGIEGQKEKWQGAWRMLSYVLWHLWPDNPGLRARVVGAVLLLVGAKVVSVQVPIVFKHIIDDLNVDTSSMLAVPTAILAAYGIARLSASIMNELRSALFSQVSQKALREVSGNLLGHLHQLDLDFHLSRQTGSLIRVIDRGSRGINFMLNAVLFNIVPTALEIGLVCYILTSSFGGNYALVTFSTLSAYTAFTFATTSWRTKFRKLMNQYENQAGSVAVDSLINYETVKYFGRERHEILRYDKELRGYEKGAVDTQLSLAFLNFGQGAIFSIGLTGMLYLASQGVVQGVLTIGDVVMIHTLLFQLSFPLNFLGTVYREIKQSIVDMENMWSLLSQKPSIADNTDSLPLQCLTDNTNTPSTPTTGIRFENVTFSYNGRSNILDRISFDIAAGSRVAFVGASGSGKSTILRLLYRFYEPQAGRLWIGDQELTSITLESLRRAIGVIPQDVCLFNDTIRYNIAYGRSDATDEDVENAAKSANIHNAIMAMPNQYNTVVGERGLKLSGGEKQRIGIARTLLKRPMILLADEATSALDSETEHKILSELRQSFHQITTIVIAHRLSTIVDADRIFVLDGGRVIESGSHHELMGLQGRYAAMWQKQQATTKTK